MHVVLSETLSKMALIGAIPVPVAKKTIFFTLEMLLRKKVA